MPGEERELESLKRVAAGERSALRPIVERHRDAVYRFAMSLTRDPAAAEDACQETFVAALRSAGAYRGDGRVRSWLLSICRNQVRAQRRRRAGEPDEHASLEALGRAGGWGALPDRDDLLERLSSRDLITKALARLSGVDREVLWLREVEGLTGEETSATLGIGLAATKSRLHRARLALVAALAAEDDP